MATIPQFSATVVTDRPDEVTAFYVETFGLRAVMDIGWFRGLRRPTGPDEADGGASPGDGSTDAAAGTTSAWELCIWEAGHESLPALVRTDAPGAGPVLAFVVDDVDAVAARVGADPDDVIDEPWGQRHVFVQDPAGTVIDVVQVTTPDPEWLAANGLADPVPVGP